MKMLFMVTLALAVILSMTAFAQYSSKEPAQKDQAAQAPLKSVDGTVKVDGDKITFVADKDQKSWAVENPEALKGHEGHHVQVKAHVDVDKGSIHIMEVKMLKGGETKKEEMKK
ncbi:MAG: hypothetical protein DMG76_33375 [Acidobacteria bacterium]|nr:MAG: hypothetical protein DMG76_33375 [Acidobacteriota bacterium]